MGESVHVKSVRAIGDFKTDLKKFGYDADQLLQDIARRIIQIQQWIKERQRYWQYQVERCQEMVRQARRALKDCLSDGERYCGDYEEELHQAYRYLRKAEEELQNVRLWKGRVGQAVSDYQREAYRLNSQLTNDVPKAGAFLEKVIAKLQEYIAVSVPTGEPGIGDIDSQITSAGSNISNPEYKETLISELHNAGISHNPDEIIRIAKTAEGKIVFLEKGKGRNESKKPSGFRHIIEEHGKDFANKGITENQIPNAIMKAVTEGKIVYTTGRNRPVYEIFFNNTLHHVGVTVSGNGYIVGANPVSVRLI